MYGFILQFALAGMSALALDPNSPLTNFLRTDFTVESGLPSNVVNAIVQTRNGFLWVGTDAGLARFNGRQFTPIYFRAPQPAAQGIVRVLAEGRDGELWVGTDSGLARIARPALNFFDRSLLTLYHPGRGPSDEIRSLCLSRNGTLWVGTSAGLYRFTGDRFIPALPVSDVIQIEESSHGHLLVTSADGFFEMDGSRFVAHPEVEAELRIRPSDLFQVFQDSGGNTWYCSMRGLARRKLDRMKLLSPGDFATEIYQDAQGTIWSQLATGLYRVVGDQFERLFTGTGRRIYGDRDGDLWVGTNGDGLLRYKNRAIRMYTQADGLPNNVSMTVFRRSDGSLWVGNNCAGLSKLDGKRFRTYAEKDGLLNSCVWALAEDKKRDLWIGTWGGGLFRFSAGRFTAFTKQQGLASDVVRAIQVARDGSLWIAGDGGLSVSVRVGPS